MNLKIFFTWWNKQTFGTFLKTLFFGKYVGSDHYGNKYYCNKKDERWVIYAKNIEATKITSDWYLWIHHTIDKVPNLKENKEITNDVTNIELSDYKSFEKKELVKNKEQVDLNIEEKHFKVIDARSKERFDGKVSEPRKGLRSGNIKNSFCIPFNLCLCEDKTFKSKKDLKLIFETCLIKLLSIV